MEKEIVPPKMVVVSGAPRRGMSSNAAYEFYKLNDRKEEKL